MNRYLFPVSVVSVCALLLGCEPEVPPENKLLKDTAAHIVQNHQQFSAATARLAGLSQSFCENVNPESLAAVRQQWRTTMSQWQAVKLTGFGPLAVDNQSWKIQFWPDKKNLIRRKSMELLLSEDSLDIERIDQASVVVQGLSAVEYLVFDPEEGQLDDYQSAALVTRRCQLLTAVTRHTQNVADRLQQGWQEYADVLSQPGDANPEFKTTQDSISALMDSLAAGLEVAKQQQLAMPLGYRQKSKRGRPYFGEAWRAQYSRDLLSANITAVQELFTAGDQYGIDDYLQQQGHGELATRLNQLLERALSESQNAGVFFTAVTDETQRQQLDTLYNTLGELLSGVKKDLPPALGVQLGFNSNDGD